MSGLDYFIDYDLSDFDTPSINQVKRNKCKYCGTGGVEWKQVNAYKWRLIDVKTKQLHICPDTKKIDEDTIL